MTNTQLQIGCDGCTLTLNSSCFHGVFFYQLISFETFINSDSKSLTFVDLKDAWTFIKGRYPKWYQFYLIEISAQMIDILKRDYIIANGKNEYTKDRWLEQLIGRGLGF